MVIGSEADAHTQCADCDHPLSTMVLKSNAGYYLGTECPNCGPYGRESDYIPTYQQAENILAIWQSSPEARQISPWRRKTGYQG
jgi:hypothetical protein